MKPKPILVMEYIEVWGMIDPAAPLEYGAPEPSRCIASSPAAQRAARLRALAGLSLDAAWLLRTA